jgi:hypothetical protein
MVISEFSEPMWVVAASIFVISSSCSNKQIIICYPKTAKILYPIKRKKAKKIALKSHNGVVKIIKKAKFYALNLSETNHNLTKNKLESNYIVQLLHFPDHNLTKTSWKVP